MKTKIECDHGRKAAHSHLHFYSRGGIRYNQLHENNAKKSNALLQINSLARRLAHAIHSNETATRGALAISVERAQTCGSITEGQNTKQSKTII